MLFNKKRKDNNIKLDPSIILPETLNGELDLFRDVTYLRWLFNYEDKNSKIYVYKIICLNMPYLYARIQKTPCDQYSIRLFNYMGTEQLNKDNLFKVKIRPHQLNYVISNTEMSLFGPNNKYGFSYDLLWTKIINEYWKSMD